MINDDDSDYRRLAYRAAAAAAAAIKSVPVITACAAATSCCICDKPFQWQNKNIDPPSSEISCLIILKFELMKHFRV